MEIKKYYTRQYDTEISYDEFINSFAEYLYLDLKDPVFCFDGRIYECKDDEEHHKIISDVVAKLAEIVKKESPIIPIEL